jgi:hypothetical protein
MHLGESLRGGPLEDLLRDPLGEPERTVALVSDYDIYYNSHLGDPRREPLGEPTVLLPSDALADALLAPWWNLWRFLLFVSTELQKKGGKIAVI